ncbi:MAG: response regulator [Desulforhopalus sp.]|nr:response regulator [Desulforhopalus sp.]
MLITFMLIAVAVLVRIWPLQSLQSNLAWLTFYPAVMIASIYGGFWTGLLATLLACLTVTKFWYLLVATPFIETSADWLGLVVFVFTGTMISCVSEAMLMANRKAHQAQLQAQKANEAKSVFLANMSHELRTPLNAILGFSQLLQRDKRLSFEHLEYLNTINQSGEHLLTLINEILEISKIEAKRTSIELSKVSVRGLISDLTKMFELKTKTKGIFFELRGMADLPQFIVTDETKLRVILINLIGNAIKFTKKGGVLADFSLLGDSLDNQQLQVSIQDTGPGIAEQEKNNLFKYFVQTESGKKEKTGTGLGLAISQDYAKMLGGEITAKSTLGEGSTFRVTIKIDKCSDDLQVESCNQRQRVIGLQPGQIPRILVAEDTTANRLLLTTLLKSVGFDVREAVNGAEAVALFESWKPHLVWMDIRMPVMDGLEATRRIKDTKEGKRTVIIGLSAHVLSEERQAIFAAGCDDFLGKPFREDDLFEIMARHLHLRYRFDEDLADNKQGHARLPLVLDLSHLSDELREHLSKAATTTDAIQLREIAENITNDNPILAKELRICADNFDYDTILSALSTNMTGQA